MEEKTQSELLREKLFMDSKHGSSVLDDEEMKKADSFSADYIDFLNCVKTEREAVSFAVDEAKKKGFAEFDRSKQYNPGDKVYFVNRNKAVILAVIGNKKADEGVRISAAHIDSPRLDLKPNPMYEADKMAFFKTHYYGGIKKYQWTVTPLALHGVVIKKDGTTVNVNVGEDENDPQFCVTDLLPHLASEQMKKPLATAIPGENLNVIIGSREFKGDSSSDSVKLNILNILNEKYGIIEEDFLSAELELVPAAKAVDIGFDRSMIGAYGHDDRVCAYPALRAALDLDVVPEYTCITVLTDKEETGSDGNTGLNSSYLKYFVYDIAKMQGCDGREALSKSACLSADVNAAYDPNYADVYEKRNSSFINNGVVVTKYTGARGKSGTSDASAEFMYRVRTMLDNADVLWQTGELGKIDIGGGGTVAMYIANLDVDVVDVGVPVLSMHAPFEIVSKIDVYMAYKAFSAFYNAK